MNISLISTLIHEDNFLKLKQKDPSFRESNLALSFDDIRGFYRKHWEYISQLVTMTSDLFKQEKILEDSSISVYPTVILKSFSHPLFLRVGNIEDSKIFLRPDFLIVGQLIHELFHYKYVDDKLERKEREGVIEAETIELLGKLNRGWAYKYQDFIQSVK